MSAPIEVTLMYQCYKKASHKFIWHMEWRTDFYCHVDWQGGLLQCTLQIIPVHYV